MNDQYEPLIGKSAISISEFLSVTGPKYVLST